jgi:hypothetical protein
MRRKSNQRKSTTASTIASFRDRYQTQYTDVCKVSSKFTQLNPRFNENYYRTYSHSRRSLSRDSSLVNSQDIVEREDTQHHRVEANVNCLKQLLLGQNLSALISRTFFE